MKRSTLLSLIASLALTLTFSTIQAQQIQQPDVPRTISYQGLLTSTDGTPLPDGPYDIAVSLFLDEDGTQPLWNATFNTDVRNGVFNILLGNDRHPLPAPLQMNRPLWVGTAVNGSPLMRPLSPLTASPYALNLPDRAVTTAKLDDGAVTAEKMGTPYVAGIALNGKTITADGSVLNIEVGEGIALTYDEETRTLKLSKSVIEARGDGEKGSKILGSPLAWDSQGDLTDGAVGGQTTAAGDWIGTSANPGNGTYDFEIRVNNQRTMLYRPNGTNTPNVIGGYRVNAVGNGSGNVIAGGGQNGRSNQIADNSNYGVIGGGDTNVISGSANWAVIGGGRNNRATGDSSTVGGGGSNFASGDASTISGGDNNTASALDATIGGGDWNVVSGIDGTIAGGDHNTVSADDATVGGGDLNTASGINSIVGGGEKNTASGTNATVGGGDTNLVSGDYGFIGGGRWNTVTMDWGTIAGGDSNLIDDDGTYSAIGGGWKNIVLGNVGTIGGGWNNIIRPSGEYNTIGGGYTNIIRDQSYYATISGGVDNVIDTNANSTVIGGGSNNHIGIVSHASTVGGGNFNAVGYDARYNVIAGGEWNAINDGTYHSAIGGGSYNTIEADLEHGTIGGGYRNLIDSNADYTFIGGGSWNSVYDNWGTIAGGDSNLINVDGTYSAIGGGVLNTILSTASAIAGGEDNIIDSLSGWSVVGGGESNIIKNSTWAAVVGGQANRIIATGGGGGNFSYIGGGDSNFIANQFGVINGGFGNEVTNYNGTIGGGRRNSISGHTGTIGGGFQDTIEALEGTIGGGSNNYIHDGADHSTIAGGSGHDIEDDAQYASIGGGADNEIIAPPISSGGTVASMATIPGGDNLVAQSWAQTVIGGWNEPKGSVPFRYNGSYDPDDPIFIIGNGSNGNDRTNAFEVSYNGHSVVYDRNTSGTARSAIRGATYTDNVVYAWGIATPNQGMVNFCDFGVASILYLGVGHYRVIINPVKPDGSSMTLGCGSVTATITTPNRECAYINTSALSGNQFDVFISEPGLVTTMSGGFVTSVGLLCNPIDLPFSFKVTARPPAN